MCSKQAYTVTQVQRVRLKTGSTEQPPNYPTTALEKRACIELS